MFLQKRSLKKDRQPGVWDSSASGHVDSGEDYDACAVRELREEIGLQLDAAPKRLFKLAACAETDQEHVWVYRCQAEGPFRLDPDEIERGGWFAPEEVTRWMEETAAGFRERAVGDLEVRDGRPRCSTREIESTCHPCAVRHLTRAERSARLRQQN